MFAGTMTEDRRKRGSVPTQVHEALVEEYDKTGSPPPAHILSEVTGIDVGSVRRALKTLCDDGILAQPHGNRAPYIPLYRPDGTQVKPKLVVVGGESEEESSKPEDVDLERVSTEELLAEVLRRTQKDESK